MLKYHVAVCDDEKSDYDGIGRLSFQGTRYLGFERN